MSMAIFFFLFEGIYFTQSFEINLEHNTQEHQLSLLKTLNKTFISKQLTYLKIVIPPNTVGLFHLLMYFWTSIYSLCFTFVISNQKVISIFFLHLIYKLTNIRLTAETFKPRGVLHSSPSPQAYAFLLLAKHRTEHPELPQSHTDMGRLGESWSIRWIKNLGELCEEGRFFILVLCPEGIIFFLVPSAILSTFTATVP